jgi:hypothetical protein
VDDGRGGSPSRRWLPGFRTNTHQPSSGRTTRRALSGAYPATIDGMIYVSSMAMLDGARRGLRSPALARWMPGTGIAATLAVNVLPGCTPERWVGDRRMACAGTRREL